jgi:hypothetical protein
MHRRVHIGTGKREILLLRWHFANQDEFDFEKTQSG